MLIFYTALVKCWQSNWLRTRENPDAALLLVEQSAIEDFVTYLFSQTIILKIQTQDGWVRSANANSVLCRPPKMQVKMRLVENLLTWWVVDEDARLHGGGDGQGDGGHD